MNVSYCPQCNNRYPSGYSRCGTCGIPLRREETAAAPVDFQEVFVFQLTDEKREQIELIFSKNHIEFKFDISSSAGTPSLRVRREHVGLARRLLEEI